MKRRTYKRAIMIIFALLLVFATGCGDTDEPVDDGSGTDPAGDTAGAYDSYPEKPITMIVPFGPGGDTDLQARAVAQYMGEEGFNVVVQNIDGGGAVIGAMEAYNAEPDGYTVLFHSVDVMFAQVFTETFTGDPLDFEMVGYFGFDPGIICVAQDSPFKTLDEFVSYAKEHPGELTLASVSTMGLNHLSSILFFDSAGIDVTYVPYNSTAESRAALLGGHADAIYGLVSGMKNSVDSGEFVPLAVAKEERSEFLPDAPTFPELGYPDIVTGLNRTVECPPGTPPEILAKLETALKNVYDNPDAAAVLTTLGLEMGWASGADTQARLGEIKDTIEEYYQKAVANE